MATSHIYLLISITICIICILPLIWLPVYKAEPDAAAAAEVMYYQRLAAERTIQAKYEYAVWCMRPVRKSILLPAAPIAPRWFDEPNWYDYVTALDIQHLPEDDHALVDDYVTALDLQHLPEDDHALVWYPDENHWE